jgi:hypothetical protein
LALTSLFGGGGVIPQGEQLCPFRTKAYKNNMVFNHFDQFEIIRIIPFHPFGNFDISITNSTIFMVTAVAAFYTLSKLEKGYIVPTR